MESTTVSVRILVMTIKEQIEQDIKSAMLGGDKILTTTLRTIKSVALNSEINMGLRDKGLSDEEYVEILVKESKKRQESIDMYTQGGNSKMADAETAEKKVIERYLPTQLDDSELTKLINDTIKSLNATGIQAMGQVISDVKKITAGKADGGRIAQIVKKELDK